MNRADVSKLADQNLITQTEFYIRKHRELETVVIWHLQEVEDRKLYIQMGYTTMLDCLIRHFKLSEAVAYTRLSALRILREVPAAAKALATGETNVTNLTLASSHFRKQEKQAPLSAEQKAVFLNEIKNKTTREVREVIARVDPTINLPIDRVVYLSQDKIQLQMTVGKELLEQIEHLKSLISHQNINPSYGDLMKIMLSAAIEKIEKKKGIHLNGADKQTETGTSKTREDLKKLTKSSQADKTAAASKTAESPKITEMTKSLSATQSNTVKNSRYISRKVKRFVLARSHGQCEHISSDGRRCCSKFQPQFDHRVPYSKGGSRSFQNIQLLCRVHNSLKSDSVK